MSWGLDKLRKYLKLDSQRELIQEGVILMHRGMILLPIRLEKLQHLLDELMFELLPRIGPINPHNPLIQLLFLLVVDRILAAGHLRYEIINIPHHIGEHENSHEFDDHRENVLAVGKSVDVAISEGREGRVGPVNRCDVSKSQKRAYWSYFFLSPVSSLSGRRS